MTSREGWLERVGAIRQWRRGDERAPHKPLLLLYAFSRLQRLGESTVAYSEAEAELRALLQEFGPPNATSPSYPFHHLTTDGLWKVTSDEGDGSPGSAQAKLRSTHAVGALTPDFQSSLVRDPGLLAQATRLLLDTNFEPSIQEDIVERLGLDLVGPESRPTLVASHRRARRDPAFREAVLVAYEWRCAMCGLDPQIENVPVGVDAAHVRWWAFEGPDDLSNGICLCTLHHKLFDRGAMGLDENRVILVSDLFRANGEHARAMVLGLAGRNLAEPQAGKAVVDTRHIMWHRREVFRGAPRQPAA